MFSVVSSPKDLPITHGSMSDFAADPVVCMRRLWAQHGPIAALQEDGQRIFFIFSPEYNKQVLSDSKRFHSRFFAVRGSKRSSQRRVSSGLLSMNGAEHREHRRMVMEPFQKKTIVGYHDDVIKLSDEMISTWTPGEVRDINADMTHYMLRVTCSILFGLDIPELAYRVGELTERWVAMNHRIGPAAFAPNPELTDQYDQLLSAAEELEGAIREMVAARRQTGMRRDVLSLLLEANEANGIYEDHLIGHISLLFGAAHLTSAHTLTWTLFLLSQHPHVMRELHQELETKLAGKPVTRESLDELTLLDRVLKESMRVLPASSYSQRMAAEPVELGPFSLPAGAVVIFSQFITHHLPELYPQPERFDPARWETISPSPYAYLPFGAGPRMCIGAPLGMMQLKISLSCMLQRFRFQVVPHSRIDGKVVSTMLHPMTEVPMRVQHHDGTFASAPVTGNIHTLVDLPPAVAVERRAA